MPEGWVDLLRVMVMDVAPGLAIFIIVIVAIVVGFEAGRWWAQTMRGLFDARMAWRRRKMYRKRKKRKSVSGNAPDSNH